jgi:hypothetical protein
MKMNAPLTPGGGNTNVFWEKNVVDQNMSFPHMQGLPSVDQGPMTDVVA